MEHRFEHHFAHITPATYWNLFFFDEAYNDALYAHLGVAILEKTIDGALELDATSRIERHLSLKPQRSAPGFVDKLLGKATTIREDSRLDMDAGTMATSIHLPTIGGRVDFGGTYTWRPEADGFVRIWSGHCHARFPLVGKKMERYFLGELEKDLERSYQFTLKWLADPR